ncbi:DUF3820 family protein [Wandonia haliotis]|uniref:DUF3820 family protein n=1 Tax=Wandonia haliotis TaxID=574963 RepID=A0ABP3Y3Y4_9FLAO
MQKEHLIKLANTKMPFGKYQGHFLVDLPEPYLVWFRQNGFPKGTIGSMLEEMLEIKINGLEHLIRPLIRK